MYRQGIEVKKDIDVGVLVEKPLWFSFVESLYPKNERVYFPDDQDEMLCLNYKGVTIGFVAGKGSSIAACMTERLRVYGAKAIVRIGTCGALSKSVNLWSPVITTACFSNEGTSGHYLPKGYPILSDVNLNNILIKNIVEAKMDYQQGITITTDGRWREDPVLMQQLNNLGVMSIEMETAAILSVCQFRKIPASAINIPVDVPTKKDSKNDLKGIPNVKTYHAEVKKVMTKIIPVVVEALTEYYKDLAK
jgi:uridine phosphorylase